jgi:hypothetical protein
VGLDQAACAFFLRGALNRTAANLSLPVWTTVLGCVHTADVGAESDGRGEQIMALLHRDRQPLDDDQIARAVPMNRHYVKQICRQLAIEGVITRDRGTHGRLVNRLVSRESSVAAEVGLALAAPETPLPRLRVRSYGLMDNNVEKLIADFAECVTLFERQQAFPGPSLYFHERAIERQRRHATVSSLLDDDRLLEYVYAVLPAWGMHRMGAQRAKVGNFAHIVNALREVTPALERLWPLRITGLQARPGR